MSLAGVGSISPTVLYAMEKDARPREVSHISRKCLERRVHDTHWQGHIMYLGFVSQDIVDLANVMCSASAPVATR